MIYTSENNWYYWNYDGVPFSRQSGNQKFTTTFSPSKITVDNFRIEMKKAASSTLDHYAGLRPSILFSGGLDSEIMLRSYLEIGANPDVFIFRYENDYNIYDVSHAITICSILDIDYTVIDFNLKKFYENDAERYSELSQIDRPKALPYCKFIEMIDGLPILGASDLTLMRVDDDYTKKGIWFNRCWEHDVGWSKFIKVIEKPAIAEWFKWTPGLVSSFLKLEWCNDLINDKIYGKLGTNSSKILGYREAYPDLLHREKKTGFENIDIMMNEYEEFLCKKYNGLIFRNECDRPISELVQNFA
ncbi:MAG TPA: hypothetical protein VIS28_06080 [Nitrososphaeraceae archaeon]